KAAAETMRSNPKLDAQAAITELSVGEGLVSFLDEKGRPNMVERCFIVPPASRVGPITEVEREAAIKASALYGRYETPVDRESAYEKLKGRTTARQETAAPAPSADPGAGKGVFDTLGGILIGQTGPRGGHRDGLL